MVVVRDLDIVEVDVVVLVDTEVAMYVETVANHGCHERTFDLCALALVNTLLT